MTEFNGATEFQNIGNAEMDESGLIECAVLPLRAAMIFPEVVSPVFIGSKQALAAVEAAALGHQTIIGLALRTQPGDIVQPENLYGFGVELALGRLLHMPDDNYSALAQGRRRVEIVEFTQIEPYLIAKARPVGLDEEPPTPKVREMMQAAVGFFRTAVELNENIPDDVLFFALNAEDPGWLADLIVSTLTLSVEERQRVLEMIEPMARLEHVAHLLSQEVKMLELKDDISNQVQQEMDRGQREHYLREQMRIIQTELGEDDIFQQELDEVRQQIEEANLPPDVLEKALKELARLSMMAPMAPEVGMLRTYIDWLTDIPWQDEAEDNLDIGNAAKILDAEHYGLAKVKDRILEYIAVRKLAGAKMKSPILCFVGPPGVGKTSLGRSIARAIGREFVRVSLGGVRDEAEIRGHRRTYIGAMPGRIIQTMRRVDTVNPVFMLDEIDKLGMDFRGDPASALLEVLDPEQNNQYSDHYLELPYDLSKVLFITTANDLDTLPPALLDRLEIIEFPGYTEEEKIAIARQFLIPRQLEEHGLDTLKVRIEQPALQLLIREYTYEAGVRNLNREIANVCRKVARLVAEGKRYPHSVSAAHLERFLGPAPFDELRANDEDAIGLATGLAWTPFGGDVLTIEVSVLPGKGNLMMTGSLGEVMQESAQAALSYMRSRADDFDIPHDDFESFDVHVHLPEGAVPKEGPSAGITLAIAIISAFTEQAVRADFAMTGEVTLRGKVLPVGGIKEKVLAARRAGVRNIILPKVNAKDLKDVPKEALQDLKIYPVENMQQVMDLVLLEPPAEGRKRDILRQEREKDEEAEAVES